MWMVSEDHAGGHHASRDHPSLDDRARTGGPAGRGGRTVPPGTPPPAPDPQPAATSGLDDPGGLTVMPGMLGDVRAHEVSPAFVGRKAELATLVDACERARTGVPGAVLL